jgi:hypothetical protein
MMSRGQWVLGTVAVLILGTSPASAQSITGLGKDLKAKASIDAGPGSLASDWSAWSVDGLVQSLVHQPVKVSGLRGLEARQWPEVKLVMSRAEVSVRTIAAALQDGTVDQPTARAALEAVLADYHRVLEGLAAR